MDEPTKTAYVLTRYEDSTGAHEVGEQVTFAESDVDRLVAVGIFTLNKPQPTEVTTEAPAEPAQPAS